MSGFDANSHSVKVSPCADVLCHAKRKVTRLSRASTAERTPASTSPVSREEVVAAFVGGYRATLSHQIVEERPDAVEAPPVPTNRRNGCAIGEIRVHFRGVESVQDVGRHLVDDRSVLDGRPEEGTSEYPERRVHHRRLDVEGTAVAHAVGQALGLLTDHRDVRVESFPEEGRLDVLALTTPLLVLCQKDALAEDPSQLLSREVALLVGVTVADEDAPNLGWVRYV